MAKLGEGQIIQVTDRLTSVTARKRKNTNIRRKIGRRIDFIETRKSGIRGGAR